MSRINQPPVSLQRIAKWHKGKDADNIYAIVGTVTNDLRLLDCPKVNVAALHFTATARARIIKSGGRALTFDELAIQRPTGSKVILRRGSKNARESVKHFRGIRGAHAKPYVRSTGRKFEKARGRRPSRGLFKHKCV